MGSVNMLEGIFGNASAEKVLLYLEQYEEGYATAIARTFDGLSLNMAQRQLDRFERAGALVSSHQGRTRLYTWNPRYPFRRELRALGFELGSFAGRDLPAGRALPTA